MLSAWLRCSAFHEVGFITGLSIQKELAENGDNRNVKTIAASTKRQGLTPKAARKFKCTTDSKRKMPVAPNLLAQDFNTEAPNQKWAETSPML